MIHDHMAHFFIDIHTPPLNQHNLLYIILVFPIKSIIV